MRDAGQGIIKTSFKGTLFYILAAFFIIFCISALLSFVEAYWNNYRPRAPDIRAEDNIEIEQPRGIKDGYLGINFNHSGIRNIKQKTEELRERPRFEDKLGFLFRKILGIKTVYAAGRNAYEAKFLIRSASELTLRPGERVKFILGFKNTGDVVWENEGEKFISIYTYGPKYRKSFFEDSSWYSSRQPTKLKNAPVLPGQIGFIEFFLKAPALSALSGAGFASEYREVFHLAAEDTAWIPGGEFEMLTKLDLDNTPVSSLGAVTREESLPQGALDIKLNGAPDRADYEAILLLRSHKELKMAGGSVVKIRLGFKNIGTESWKVRGLKTSDVQIAAISSASPFYWGTWASNNQPIIVSGMVKPGELAFVEFKMKVPEEAGEYSAKFHLTADGKNVKGGFVELPVTVTENAAEIEDGPIIIKNIKMQEPDIRIGLFYTQEPIELTADREFEIRDINDAVVAEMNPLQPVNIVFDFAKKEYRLTSALFKQVLSAKVRFVPQSEDAVFTILNYSHPTETGWNDNKFRGKIEINQSPNTDRLWVINELPLEKYLYGLAETSNDSPLEYQKALVTAARTYALYHFFKNTKYDGFFTLRAWAGDQVYRGYNSELRRPKQKNAVDAIRGQAVTKDGDIVITPYFSRSDGRTRDWTEVWAGSKKSWLVSVPASYDRGLAMWGHGVGMSANDAYGRAKNDGWRYDEILKYYYTGIEITKVY